MAGEEQPDSLASPWEPSWLGLINLPQECCITAFHYMNSPLMGFTQFMLLRLGWGGKKKNSRDQQVMMLGALEEAEKRRCVFCFWNLMTFMSYSQRPLFIFLPSVTSVHVQFVQKGETAFTQSQSQRGGSQPLLFYNHTITIFMRTPADGKTISLSPPPFSRYLPLFFCGPHSFLRAYFNEKFGGDSLGDSAGLVISTTRWRE